MKESTFTIHLLQQEDGKVKLKAIDDTDNHQIEAEYDNLSIAALEGVIALNTRRLEMTRKAEN